MTDSRKERHKTRIARGRLAEKPPADYKCFDCGHEIKGSNAGSRSYMGTCPECRGIMMVYVFDGEPVNRGFFTPEPEDTYGA